MCVLENACSRMLLGLCMYACMCAYVQILELPQEQRQGEMKAIIGVWQQLEIACFWHVKTLQTSE